ncbi:PRC-barrel domain-containing protein [Mycobacterium yunnanensis]|uniref:PRC-barrel domain-containing protein n=1 Tax=Mycobacterium yunnanensis TaxID=368477 RepID=A0A9X3C2T6_9MYCO|nr:PRC-barrel domain-containing protein [Mycobacterium yunnanensis]MCV7420907.1 PRC-barrel domain-containing protein [Mycobacterium yunnanensis]
MLLSDILGLAVLEDDGTRVGTVVDVRLGLPPGDGDGTGAGLARVLGFAVSPHPRASYLGYGCTGPAVVSTVLGWRHRGTFLAAWDDVGRLDQQCVTLRPSYRRHPIQLVNRHRDVDV